MSAADSSALLRTPLHDLHLELGARMVPFADYSLRPRTSALSNG